MIERAKQYYEGKFGLEVMALEGFAASDSYMIGKLGPENARDAFARINRPEIEAFVVPGGNFPTMSFVPAWEQELAYWVDWLEAQRQLLVLWAGRLEGLLARHWPEATRVLKITKATLLRALAHYGGPAALAADEQPIKDRLQEFQSAWNKDDTTAMAAVGRRREQLCKANQRALFVPPHEQRLTPRRLLQVGEMYRVVKPGLAQQLAHSIERTLVDDMKFAAAIDQYPHRTVKESAMLERRFKLAALKALDFFVKPAIGLVQALLHGLPRDADQCREPR